MFHILFVCHGNICRSPMAEFVMKDLVQKAGLSEQIAVESRACRTDDLGSDTYSGTKRVLREHGIPFTKRAARLVRADDYDKYDVIIGMDEENMRDLQRLTHGDPKQKYHLLMSYAGKSREVADPWYTGDFETTYRDVVLGCRALLENLQAQLKRKKAVHNA